MNTAIGGSGGDEDGHSGSGEESEFGEHYEVKDCGFWEVDVMFGEDEVGCSTGEEIEE